MTVPVICRGAKYNVERVVKTHGILAGDSFHNAGRATFLNSKESRVSLRLKCGIKK
jgi:hypothetical protein